ncbi:hypothetical protein FW755_00575 [Lonepinella koalarum]|uniref:Lipoprotein n=1 Tax=Lonepinella koalarum TaxID=53417 RepID=A0A4R1L0Q6_9PAST|nr:hypothetical protein [Lonepinella koalarum]MDH2926928.1 hypothetical protein [Lonepinella koalarum]TCK70413.1 hypothetical protein EV692_0685 [Lonepinella koalarum]TFJ90196.1 hypothetical protein E0709_06060 [Lonepinella koalarum]TYG33693.1 hypothetical protein FW755_00575 [Lonepinella koalarum]
MKKITLALAVLTTVGLSACAGRFDDNSYKGTVLSSQYAGNNSKLTVIKDNCESYNSQGAVETVTEIRQYDSDIVTGSCVRVYEDSIDNISRSESRSWISRVGIVL